MPILSRLNLILRNVIYFFEINFILPSHLCLSLPKGLLPVGLRVKILKELLPSSIPAICAVHINMLDLITLSIFSDIWAQEG